MFFPQAGHLGGSFKGRNLLHLIEPERLRKGDGMEKMDGRRFFMYQDSLNATDAEMGKLLGIRKDQVAALQRSKDPIDKAIAMKVMALVGEHYWGKAYPYPWEDTGKPYAIVSACSYGIRAKWHGEQRKTMAKILRDAQAEWTLIPVCPEVMAGFPVPRPPLKKRGDRYWQTDPDHKSWGPEVTDRIWAGARWVLKIAADYDVRRAYLVFKSPTASQGGALGQLMLKHGIEYIKIW